MRLKSLDIDNFFSFSKKQKVNFDDYGNLVLVKGIREEGADSSNGAGKSSLFESIFWCLTGRTARGVRAKDVVRMGESYVMVILVLSDGEDEVQVVRYWSEDKKEVIITRNGKEERFHDAKQGTNRIFEIMGVSPQVFSLSSFYGKHFNSFSLLSPKERADIIDLCVGGAELEAGRDKMARKKRDNQKLKEAKKLELSNNEKEERALIEEYKELGKKTIEAKKLLDEFEAGLDKKIKEGEARLDKLKSEDKSSKLKGLKKQYKDKILAIKAKEEKEVSDIYESAEEENERLDEEIDEFSELIDEAKSKVSNISIEVRELKSKREEKLEQAENVNCISCGQRLPNPPDSKKLKAEAATLYGKICARLREKKELEESVKELKDSKAELDKKKKEASSKINGEVKELRKKNYRRIKDLEGKIESVEAALDNYKYEVRKEEDNIKELRAEKKSGKYLEEFNKYNNLTIAKRDEYFKKYRKVDSLKGDLFDLEEEVDLCAYWEAGLKDIRFSSFEKAVSVLQGMLTDFCLKQGLEFDRIEVEAFREKSDGGIIPDISIYITRDGEMMNMFSLSEGETQKMDLACFFSLSMLLESSLSSKFGFAVLDEPLAGLDARGREQMFHIATDMSKEKQLFIIDHDANFQDLFNNVMVVEKKDGKSFIQ